MSYFIKDPTRSGPPGPLVVGDAAPCCAACASGASSCGGDDTSTAWGPGMLVAVGALLFVAYRWAKK